MRDAEVLLQRDPVAFAGYVLEVHGLPSDPLLSIESWSNQVWIAPDHVVRLSSGRFRGAFQHEHRVLLLLSPEIPHARVAAYGAVGDREWLILDRIPGQTLAQAWQQLMPPQRRNAIRQLGLILQVLHAIDLPRGFRNPWLDRALAPGGPVRDAYHAPPDQYRILIDASRQVPGIDGLVLDEIEQLIVEHLGAFAGDRTVLVHGDLHFANLLWSGNALVAVLDFEGARPGAPDLELDTILRFCRAPELFVRDDSRHLPRVTDLSGVQDALADTYPALFGHPRLADRLTVYEALWQLVQLLHFPPGSGNPNPWSHLQALLAGHPRWLRHSSHV